MNIKHIVYSILAVIIFLIMVIVVMEIMRMKEGRFRIINPQVESEK